MTTLQEQLRNQVDECHASMGQLWVAKLFTEAADKIDELEAQVAALTADAARYRWLRDQDDRSDAFCMYGRNSKFGDCGHHEIGSELLDEVIDAAMAQKGTT